MPELKFNQPALNIDEQLCILLEKGLIIEDEEFARSFLTHNSFFRLKRYANYFKDYKTTNGNFLPGITFRKIVDVYHFDKNLRLILFGGIETIEIAIKSQLSNIMSYKYGSHWYMTPSHFSDKFNFIEFGNTVENECRFSEEPFIQHYMKNFNEPYLPPSWMIMEILTFGTVSKMFKSLTANEEKVEICHYFKLAKNILPSWLEHIVYVRNLVAHHSKILNKVFTIKPIMPTRRNLKFLYEAEDVDNSKLYCTLCCIQFLIRKIHPASDFRNNLLSLLNHHPELNLNTFGFTTNWRKEKIWS